MGNNQSDNKKSPEECADDSTLAVVDGDTLQELSIEPVEYTGPCCEKCNTPIKSDVVAICRHCGWYGSLGTFVELDHHWETYSQESPPEAAVNTEQSHLAVWLSLVPRWGWLILSSMFAVIIESTVARLITPNGGSLRTLWSMTQLAIGSITVAVCHVFNFAVLAAEDADLGVMDMFVKPLKLWIRAFQKLPVRLWMVNAAACGLTAVVMSVLVIGGLPYERLWDWGFKQPPKQDLMGAVMDRAKKLDSRNDTTLEEAVADFAGSQNVDGASATPTPSTTPQKTREKADCVILGYHLDRKGHLSMLVLGTAYRTKLVYAGRVKPELSDGDNATLVAALQATQTLQPFITMEIEATWVRPTLACRVTYNERLKNGQLRGIEWDGLLGNVKTR